MSQAVPSYTSQQQGYAQAQQGYAEQGYAQAQQGYAEQGYAQGQPPPQLIVGLGTSPPIAGAGIFEGAMCPNCQVGVLQTHYTCCGIVLGVICFPVGFICCYLMRNFKCPNCLSEFTNPV